MSLLELLGIHGHADRDHAQGDTETVRKIVRQLEALPPAEARRLAAFAYTLGRAANADRVIDERETRVMERFVRELGRLGDEQAVLVVAIAKSQNQLFGGTEGYLVTREFRELATPEEREHLLHCAFAVAAADDSISSVEEARLEQLARELGFGRAEYIRIRSAYNDKRAVVQMLRETAAG